MDEDRKRITLQFPLDTLAQASGNSSHDIVLSDNPGQHTVLWRCAIEILKVQPPPYVPPASGMVRVTTFPQVTREEELAAELYPFAADVLWQLCLRGYLRPGARGPVQYYQRPGGEGYSLTLRGREWIKAVPEGDVSALLAAL